MAPVLPPPFSPPPKFPRNKPRQPKPDISVKTAKLKQKLKDLDVEKKRLLGIVKAKKEEIQLKIKVEIIKAQRAALGAAEKVQEAIAKKIKAFKEKLDPIYKKIDKLKKDIEKIVDNIKKKIDEVLEKINKIIVKVKNAIDSAKKLLQDSIDYLINTLQTFIKTKLQQLMKAMDKALAEAKKWVNRQVQTIKNWIKEQFSPPKGKVFKTKERLDKIKKRKEQVESLVNEIKFYVGEIKKIYDKIKDIIENPDKYLMEIIMPVLTRQAEKLQVKIDRLKKKHKKEIQWVKDALAFQIPFNTQGFILYHSFGIGATLYWTGAIIQPAPGTPGFIAVTYPGTPLNTFDPKLDLPPSDDPAETIRLLVKPIKLHLQTVQGLFLMPAPTPSGFVPTPWVGYGQTINWEVAFVQPIALGLKNGQDSLGNLIAKYYNLAIKTGFPNTPAFPIPFTSGVEGKLKGVMQVGSVKGMQGIIDGLMQIPIIPIERVVTKLRIKQEQLINKYIVPIQEEESKIRKAIDETKAFIEEMKKYIDVVTEYAAWAAEQAMIAKMWRDLAKDPKALATAVALDAVAGTIDATITDEAQADIDNSTNNLS